MSLVKEVEIIGEAARTLSEESRRAIPHLPWQEIIDMRHRLVHVYFDIDLDVVWSTV